MWKSFIREAHAPNISLTRGSTHILVAHAPHLGDTYSMQCREMVCL